MHSVLFRALAVLVLGVSFGTQAQAAKLPASGIIEVVFSPGGEATALVVRAIESARVSIRVAAYSFTSVPIAKALVDAKRRGVDVAVVVDRSQRSERYTSATFLANAGVPVRVDAYHVIQHNKYIVIDEATVQTGSFNYTKSAEGANAENVVVHWDHTLLAAYYMSDWRVHWEHAEPYAARY